MKLHITLGRFIRHNLIIGAVLLLLGALSAPAQTYPDTSTLLSGQYVDSNPTPLNYRYFQPAGYNAANTSVKYPLVIFLHGQGELGTDNTAQVANNANGATIFITAENQATNPCFWVAPQCTGVAGGWDTPAHTATDPNTNVTTTYPDSYTLHQVDALVTYFIGHYNIDPSRVYVTGLSSGGGGTSWLLNFNPSHYAAAAIASGWCDGTPNNYLLHIPVWFFHCADDGEVQIQGMDSAVDNARSVGATPIYSRYNSGGHDAWAYAYSPSTPLVQWMMAQRQGQPLVKSVGPSVAVTAPSAAVSGSFTTPATTVGFAGTTGDSNAGITSLYWENYSNWGGSAFLQGNITGTSNWSVGGIPLINNNNIVQLIGVGVAYASPGNGSTTFSSVVNVNSTGWTADTTPPTVSINAPTTASTYTVTTPVVSLAGTASDDVGVARVTWSNSQGGSGTATGTTNWSVSSVPLVAGSNVITVTVADTSFNVTTHTLTVLYSTGTSTNVAGWTSLDIGSPGAAGSIVSTGDAFTVKASGADIWNQADSFQFDYQTLNGDGTIVAQVTGVQQTDVWAKGAIMIRSNLTAGSPFVEELVSAASGSSFQNRPTQGAQAVATNDNGTAPLWIKLVRSGSTFTGYTSTDGSTWKSEGTTTVTMPTQVYVGMAATSHDDPTLTTVTFRNVSIYGNTVWTSLDIGSPGTAGSITAGTDSYTVKGAGSDIWNQADSFQFDYQTLNGDGVIIAQVTGVQQTDPWAKGAIMIRSNLTAGSPFVEELVSAASGSSFQNRPTQGAQAVATNDNGTTPIWLKLVRSGSTFTGYTSADDVTWKSEGTITVTMPTQVYIGIAVTSHADPTLTTVTLRNVNRQ